MTATAKEKAIHGREIFLSAGEQLEHLSVVNRGQATRCDPEL